MLKKIISLALIHFLILINALSAQEYYFRHYQVENGLSSNTVFCSLQDKKGFLWFGTKDGLNRFDGYTFKVFHNGADAISSLAFNFIYTLYEDNNNAIWVGTDKGLYKYDETTENLSLVNPKFTGIIRSIYKDVQGNIWFISDLKLFKYKEKTGAFRKYDQKDIFDATSICSTPDGAIWISSSNGCISRYDFLNDRFTSYNVFDRSRPSTSKRIEKVFATGRGSILIGTSSQGAKIFDISTGKYKDIITHYSDKTEVLAHDFVQQSDTTYWIATDFGIFIYNIKTERITNIRKHYNDPYSISDDAVHTLCKDREGGIWAGTYFGGINYYPKQYSSFKKYFPKTGENSISGNVVREIVKDQHNHFWIGTEDAGLNKFDAEKDVFTHYFPTGNKNNLSFSTIFGLLAVDDKLWIGTYQHGLDILDIAKGTVVKHYNAGATPNSLKNNFIETFYRTRSGQILIGTLLGLYTYNDKNEHFTTVPEIPENVFIYSILEDAEGTLWVGTKGNGVYYYNEKTKQHGNLRYEDKNENSLGSNIVNDIFEDSNKNLWFATEGGGLCRFNRIDKTFRRYTTKNGLPGNSIFKILEDDKKALWFSTSKGLVNFDPATEKITVYTTSNGLLSDQFSNNSGYKDSTGRMYFGSVKGLISFNPAEFIKNAYRPPVYITGFQIYDKEIDINQKGSPLNTSLSFIDKIKISYNQSSFSIDFAALSFTSPEKTEYAYKMEGVDKDWTYLKTKRKAYFTELSPGTYTFKVKASTSGDIWNAVETKLVVQIVPPVWRTWWAYLFYTVIATIIIAFIIYSYKRKIKEKNRRALEHFKHEQEKEIYHAKFEFFTNITHEIRTPLTLIKGPMEFVIEKAHKVPEIKKYLSIMDRNIDRLVELTNQLLDFRKVETKGFSLNFVEEDVSKILEDVYVRFKLIAEQKKLSYTIDIQEKHLYANIDTEAINKILCNLFSNAIKYAENKVEVRLLAAKKDDKDFAIEIANDGHLIPYEMKDKIFETFYRLRESENQQGTGIGLALSLTLTALHKGTLKLKRPEGNLNVFVLKLPVYQEESIKITSRQLSKKL
ncbi:ligand-binding sensor domain-containing protein [Segetibacter koreensis]|uniref:ligand-binding sensor domain-containing protein n=1 Tax=Segetibacter koreensis TaxID=398037 RepID=UPI0005242998|nr:sensor histidine kinase [Segetibacter koreensis]